MRLCEVEAKALMAHGGIALPRSRFIAADATMDMQGWNGGVAKAQLLSGGRGKAGLVRFAASEDALQAEVQTLRTRIADLGKPAGILVEEWLEIAAEYYLSFVIDDVAQCPRMLFSTQGGIEVEGAGTTVASYLVNPLAPLRPHHLLDFFLQAGVQDKALGALMRLGARTASWCRWTPRSSSTTAQPFVTVAGARRCPTNWRMPSSRRWSAKRLRPASPSSRCRATSPL